MCWPGLLGSYRHVAEANEMRYDVNRRGGDSSVAASTARANPPFPRGCDNLSMTAVVVG